MNLPASLVRTIEVIRTQSRPISIFLYGSRARNDFLQQSDYELGVFYAKEEMISEETLHSMAELPNEYHIYPYEIKSFIAGTLNIPFEESIFIKSMVTCGKTISGEQTIENIDPPPIKVVSLLREIKFQLGRASDAIVCFGSGDKELSARIFMKSCLWGTRCLVILKTGCFPVSYSEIVEKSLSLDLEEYAEMPQKGLVAREIGKIEKSDLLRNVWYLNRLIERQILDLYQKAGDQILIG